MTAWWNMIPSGTELCGAGHAAELSHLGHRQIKRIRLDFGMPFMVANKRAETGHFMPPDPGTT